MNECNEIAIVGVACRFPNAKNKYEFWRNLVNGVDSVDIVPNDRWDAEKYFSSDITEQDKTYCKWLGALEDIDKFDNNFFNISPREASNMDPNQRLLLQEVWHCLEDSAISIKEIQDKVTSVHIGSVAYEPYKVEKTDVSTANGSYYFMLANRISYFMGLKGESYTLDTGCSSSLVALRTACRALQDNTSDYAFVGGINLHLSPVKMTTWSKSRMFSNTGKCHTFDKDADGYVPGEGVGVILLQTLEKAKQCNNKIYAVIKGCAINHGGQAVSLTAPNVESQMQVIQAAYNQTDFTPDTVSYVEAHGTGTSLGDPIEVEALKQIFRKYNCQNAYCRLGSVKTNIGHLEGCAAMASLIKVILMLNNKIIPRSLHLNTMNPILDIENSPFKISTENEKWIRISENVPLRAGISSFGLGGTNAHILLEEYVEERDDAQIKNEESQIFILSAKSQQSLNDIKDEWLRKLAAYEFDNYSLADVSTVLMLGRKHFPYRVGGIVRSIQDIQDILLNMKSNCEARLNKQVFTMIEEGEFKNSYDTYKKCKKMGLTTDVISGNSTGVYVALVISGIVTEDDMMGYLSGKKSIERITIHRPIISFFDKTTNKIYKKYNILRQQLDALLNEICLDSTSCNEIFSKAKILYKHQYTFKKYVEEWEPYLSRYGNIETLLQEVYAENDVTINNPKELMLMLIILSSINKVYNKWKLKKDVEIKNQAFNDLLNLVIENIISKKECVEFVSCSLNEEEYEKMIENCNININTNESGYEYILLQNDTLTEIPDFKSWINNYIIKSTTIENVFDEYVYISLDKSINNRESFNQIVLHLWNQGVDVDWSELLGQKNYNKLELPIYCFDEVSYWTKQTKEKEDTANILSWRKEKMPFANVVQGKNIVVFYHNFEEEIKKAYAELINKNQIEFIRIEKSNNQQMIQRRLMFMENISAIYYFADLELDINKKHTVTDFIGVQESAFANLLSIIKVLHICGYSSRKLDFTFVTNNVHNIDKTEKCAVLHMGVQGLMKSIAMEFADWNIKCCDIDINEDVTANIVAVLGEETNGEIAYRKGFKYERELVFRQDEMIGEKNTSSLEEIIMETLVEVLHIELADILKDESFLDMGMDSITELEMVNIINKKFEIKLMPTDLFVYDTVYELEKFVRNEFSIL